MPLNINHALHTTATEFTLRIMLEIKKNKRKPDGLLGCIRSGKIFMEYCLLVSRYDSGLCI